MIRLDEIKNKRLKVKDDVSGRVFIASVIQDRAGVVGVAAWEIDAKPVQRRKHRLLSCESRENWLAHLDLLEGSDS